MTTPKPGQKCSSERLFFRPDQAMAVFGMSRKTVYRLAEEGRIGIYKLGPMTFFRVSEVTQLLEANRQ